MVLVCFGRRDPTFGFGLNQCVPHVGINQILESHRLYCVKHIHSILFSLILTIQVFIMDYISIVSNFLGSKFQLEDSDRWPSEVIRLCLLGFSPLVRNYISTRLDIGCGCVFRGFSTIWRPWLSFL